MKTAWVDDEAHAVLEKLKKQKRKSSINEVIRFLIAEHTVFEQEKQNVPILTEDDSLSCINRIIHDGCYWCVNKPPKMVKLLTLDICKVCKQRKLGLTESTKMPQPTMKPQPLSDPNLKMDRYGMVYCHDGGLWVYPSKCDGCKKLSFSVWDECQKKQRNPQVKVM